MHYLDGLQKAFFKEKNSMSIVKIELDFFQ